MKNQVVRGFLLSLLVMGPFYGGHFALAQNVPADSTQKRPEIPEGVLFKGAPDFSKWTVTFSDAVKKEFGGKPRSGLEPEKLITTKTRNLVREELVDINGCRTETWHAGAIQYRKPHGETIWYEPLPPNESQGGSSDYSPIPAKGFREWEWVGDSSYVGRVPFDEVDCLAFVPGAGKPVDEEDPKKAAEQLAKTPIVAYVNAETRLPFALRSGDVIRRFTFESPPAEMQVLPPDLLDQIKKGKEAKERLFQPAARPY